MMNGNEKGELDLAGWLTLADAGHVLGLSSHQVRRLAISGLLPATRVWGRWLVRGDAVLALKERRGGRRGVPYE